MSWQRKTTVFLVLLCCYIAYSAWVYTEGTEQYTNVPFSEQAAQGKQIWQQNNCVACHQLYGLGGYLGPELTTIISDSSRGTSYAVGMLKSGGTTMPNFHFTDEQVNAVIAYLTYVDASVHNNQNRKP